MFELRVAVRVRRPFSALAHRLQPIAKLMQQSTHRRRAHLPARAQQRRGELRPTLARPPQRRLRVAARQRVNQLLQRLLDARLRLLDARSSGPRTANSTALSAARFQLPAPLADGRARQSRRVRNQSIASISDGTRFRGRPDTTPALIEKPLDRSVLLNDGRFEFNIASHRGSRTQNPSVENIIYASVLSGTKPSSSMISSLYFANCFWNRNRRFSSLASMSSWTKAAAVIKPTVRPF